MKNLIPIIKRIAESITRTENMRKKLANFLRDIEPEVKLVYKSTPGSLENIKIVGIDGGLIKKSLHGFDCILTRAAGVCFCYKDSRIQSVKYFPSRFPTPIPEVFENLSDMDWNYTATISRQRTEIKTAVQCIDRFEPDVLLLDGLAIPHYSDKPSKSSIIYAGYKELIDNYKQLYEKARKRGILLAGVIEDSRSAAFCNLIKEDALSQVKGATTPLIELLDKTRDTNLLFLLLEKGERSKVFKYAKSSKEHPVLRDFDEYGEKIYSFYLKTAKWDRPIRIDFLSWSSETIQQTADKLASVLLAVSGQHSGYGLPTPLIEADNVAKLSDNEMENFYSQILSLTGNTPSVMKLRREQRPF